MSRVRKGYCSKNPRLRKVFIIYKKLDCRYPVIKETSTKKNNLMAGILLEARLHRQLRVRIPFPF